MASQSDVDSLLLELKTWLWIEYLLCQILPQRQRWRQRLLRQVLCAQARGHRDGGDHVQPQNPRRNIFSQLSFNQAGQYENTVFLCRFTGDQKKRKESFLAIPSQSVEQEDASSAAVLQRRHQHRRDPDSSPSSYSPFPFPDPLYFVMPDRDMRCLLQIAFQCSGKANLIWKFQCDHS